MDMTTYVQVTIFVVDMELSINGEYPIAGLLIVENTIKMDDFGVPP